MRCEQTKNTDTSAKCADCAGCKQRGGSGESTITLTGLSESEVRQRQSDCEETSSGSTHLETEANMGTGDEV